MIIVQIFSSQSSYQLYITHFLFFLHILPLFSVATKTENNNNT